MGELVKLGQLKYRNSLLWANLSVSNEDITYGKYTDRESQS